MSGGEGLAAGRVSRRTCKQNSRSPTGDETSQGQTDTAWRDEYESDDDGCVSSIVGDYH